MPIEKTPHAWWLEPLPTDSSAEANGLSSAEAKSRLARFGPNQLHERQEKSLLRQYLSRFKNPLVLILLVASAVSASIGDSYQFSHYQLHCSAQCYA